MQYRYDSMGNIVEVFENGRSTCRYEYDSPGRLTREDNVAFAKTTTWAYDNNGNIIARYEYALTATKTSELHLLESTYIPYAYDDNSDQLMSYNGEAFDYDIIGKPTTYHEKTFVNKSKMFFSALERILRNSDKCGVFVSMREGAYLARCVDLRSRKIL